MSAARRPGLAIAALFALIACAFQIYAFHWGVIMPDSVVQYGQALSGYYDDWHPPVTAWLWRQLLRLTPSQVPGGAPMLILDALLYWGALLLIACVLLRRRQRLAAWLLLLMGLLPIPFGQVGSVLKDPLLACLLAMATALVMLRENRGSFLFALAALPLIVIAAATRFNGAFAGAPLLVLLLPRRWTLGAWRPIAWGIGAAMLLAITSWTINVALLKPHRSQPFIQLVNFDIAGIIAHGGHNGYPLLNDRLAAAFVAHCYTPATFGAQDESRCEGAEDSISTFAARPGESAVGVWLNAIVASPIAYIEHRAAHLNQNMRFLVAAVPNDAVYAMSAPNPYGLHFEKTPIAKAISEAGWRMAISPIGRPATWLAIAIGLLIVAPTLPSRRIVTGVAVSAIVYGGAYALVSVATDLRYHLWALLAILIGIAVVVAEQRTLRLWRLGLALAPAIVVMAIEWRALG